MRIDVHVKASKNENKVIKKGFADYEVWVKAPPIDGRANKMVLAVLADYFNVKRYNLRIVKGLTLPYKIIEMME